MKGSKPFENVAATEEHLNWGQLIKREHPLYARENDIRSEFGRDYTRILHCLAYRRLKHKTQVFFDTNNDHICTRMEHVAHVESVSFTIARFLGLNTELTKAISAGHDLGHAPFGHRGEEVIDNLVKEHLKEDFWHERNGLRFVDKIELLEDNKRLFRNLNLTYAVRDGIISHCGELDENNIYPRTEYFDLEKYKSKGQCQPFTWEGCVVKLSDKIAYIGRDIEDAIRLKFLNEKQMNELKDMASKYKLGSINTTTIMHKLIIDLCSNSYPECGLNLSRSYFYFLNDIKEFNYDNIYKSSRLDNYKLYSKMVIERIFYTLLNAYSEKNTIIELSKRREEYRELIDGFLDWLVDYCNSNDNYREYKHDPNTYPKYRNVKIYGSLSTKEIYIQAIIDYISGMTDKYAIRVFQESVRF